MGSVAHSGTGSSVNYVSYGNERWAKVAILVHSEGKKYCENIIFNKENCPRDGRELFIWFKRVKRFKTFLDNKNLPSFNKHQYQQVFPSTGVTDTSDFDIPLLCNIIEIAWKEKYLDFIKILRHRRNHVFHTIRQLTEAEFENLWNEVLNEFEEIGHDTSHFENLKEAPLDGNYSDLIKKVLELRVQGEKYNNLFL